MNIKKILSENMYCAFLALCAVLLSESALFRFAGISNPLCVGITAVVFTATTVFLYLNRKNSAAYVGFAAVITLIIWVLNMTGINAFACAAAAANSLFTGRKLEDGEVFLVSAIMSALLSAVLFPLLKIRPARFVASVITLAALIAYGFCDVTADPAEVFAAAGIILAVLAEVSISLMYKKESGERLSSVVSFLLPVFAFFSLAAAIIPSSAEPIKWEFASKLASGVVGFFESVAADISFALNPSSAEFGIGMQGYSDASGIFGTGISSDGAQQLTVSAYTRPRASVYLIGNANDTYTGKGWSKSGGEDFSADEYYLDYCEAMCAFERAGYSTDKLADFTAKTSLTITYDDIITKTLFYPLKTCEIFCSESFDAKSSSVIFDGKQSDGTMYNLKYLEINYRSDEFINAAVTDFDYGSCVGAEHYLDKKIPPDIYEKLSRRAEFIRESYTALPTLVTQRTRELAAQITADCSTDYDKLRAIEAYLRSYTYTTSPGSVPDGADPVDYFLFESHEGYCTYFASAMTLLSRCVGIPSRYVQGFTVLNDNNSSFDKVAVTNSNAHAWSEAYIEGVGWIPFEATAAYADSRYSFRGRPQLNGSYNIPYYDYHEETEAVPFEPLSELPVKNEISVFVPIILFSLLVLLLIAVLYVVVKLRIFTNSYKKDSDTEKFMVCYRMIDYLCRKNKLIRGSGETADRFAERVSLRYAEMPASFTEITETFDRIRYGGTDAAADERTAAENYLRHMFEEIKQTRGKPTALSVFIGYCFK